MKHSKKDSFRRTAIVLILASFCGCSSTPEKTISASSYNIQFLTPSWYSDTDPIQNSHWPNSTERALEIAHEAFADCPGIILLQESVNDTHRSEILDTLKSECNPGFQLRTLQHDWDPVIDAVVDGPAYLMAVMESVLEEADKAALDALGPDATPEEALQLLIDLQSGGLAGGTVREPTPIIDEEVAILTPFNVIEVNDMEFSLAAGFDKFAAKGVLHARLHVTNRVDPPPARPLAGGDPSLEPCDPLDPLVGDCEEPVLPPDEGTFDPEAAGSNMDVYVTHLNADSRPHGTQIAELLDFIASTHKPEIPLLVGGDFNFPLYITDGDGVRSQGIRFRRTCDGITAATPDPLPTDDCDSTTAASPFNLQFADIGPTNREGWDTDLRRPAMDSGAQIDHLFFYSVEDLASFSRRYNPLRPFDPPPGLVAAGRQTLSDHAELEMSGEIALQNYIERAPYTADRVVQVIVHEVYAGVDDGCGAPDPKGEVLLQVDGRTDAIAFGPADDKSSLTVNKTLTLPATGGVFRGRLFIDLSEHDRAFCGGDDELDIDPAPDSTNAEVDLDFTWDGGIQLNGAGLGWFGQPVTLNAAGNSITFTVLVEER